MVDLEYSRGLIRTDLMIKKPPEQLFIRKYELTPQEIALIIDYRRAKNLFAKRRAELSLGSKTPKEIADGKVPKATQALINLSKKLIKIKKEYSDYILTRYTRVYINYIMTRDPRYVDQFNVKGLR